MRSGTTVRRSAIALCLVMAASVLPTCAYAQDVEALKREIEQMRKQLQTLTERLQAVESQRPAAVAAPPAPGPAAPAAPAAPAPPATGAPSLADLARPREPFGLYERRGPGQLLFDIGIAGDLVGNLTQRNVDKANAGTFAGRENRFFPREIELSLFGQVDPYARAEVRIEAGEEDQGEITVNLAEAHLTLLTLPFGTQVKLGQMRNRFGLLNQTHAHDRPFVDQPAVLTRFFGEEGLVERGVELTWVPPLPFFLELLAGVFNGDNEEAFGYGKLNQPLLTARLRTFFELDALGAIQLGASVASGETPERHRSTLVGVDLKYKYTPESWAHPLVTVGGEAIFSTRRVNVFGEDVDGDGIVDTPDETRTRDRWGWYAWAELQPWRRWAFGVRYDWTEFPVARGREWAVEPYVTFMLSEFLRFRLAYRHTERDKRDLFGDNGGSGRIVDELLLQATFVLGAHPAHPF
jgi:hypothetical protein